MFKNNPFMRAPRTVHDLDNADRNSTQHFTPDELDALDSATVAYISGQPERALTVKLTGPDLSALADDAEKQAAAMAGKVAAITAEIDRLEAAKKDAQTVLSALGAMLSTLRPNAPVVHEGTDFDAIKDRIDAELDELDLTQPEERT